MILLLLSILLGTTTQAAVHPFLDSSLPPCRSGPWGDIKCIPVTVAPSDDVVAELIVDYPLKNDWFFPNISKVDLANEFLELGMSSEWIKMAAMADPDRRTKGVRLAPPERLVAALTKKQRSALYDRLAEFPLNKEQVNAFRFPGNDVEKWIHHAGLSHRAAELFRKYSYTDNNFVFFADLSLALPELPDPKEKALFLKALSRQHTYLVKLVVDPKSSPKDLARYWGIGKRKKDVLPLIDSIRETGERHHIDISHLLPNFSRKLIYTYPSLSEDEHFGKLDCFWSALNFFNQADNYTFLSGYKILEEIKQNYVLTTDTPRLGDMLVYSNPQRGPFHAAIYIAGGVVFTKNGSRISAPWIYSTLAEMERYYSEYESVSVSVYRKKDFIQPDPTS